MVFRLRLNTLIRVSDQAEYHWDSRTLKHGNVTVQQTDSVWKLPHTSGRFSSHDTQCQKRGPLSSRGARCRVHHSLKVPFDTWMGSCHYMLLVNLCDTISDAPAQAPIVGVLALQGGFHEHKVMLSLLALQMLRGVLYAANALTHIPHTTAHTVLVLHDTKLGPKLFSQYSYEAYFSMHHEAWVRREPQANTTLHIHTLLSSPPCELEVSNRQELVSVH